MVKVLHVDSSVERMVSPSYSHAHADGWGSSSSRRTRRRKQRRSISSPPEELEGGTDVSLDCDDPFSD
jgi:hypothetical protein